MPEKYYYCEKEFYEDVKRLAERIGKGFYKEICPIPRGGVPVALELSRLLGIPIESRWLRSNDIPDDVIIIDDIVDSGKTRARYPNNDFACIHESPQKKCKNGSPTIGLKSTFGKWIVYWWEGNVVTSAGDIITRFFEYIGEDSTREGLIETPARVLKSWDHLFSGYKKDPLDIIKTFKAETYDQMVICRDIEMYSTCEHHLLPFIGKAHVAYIPSEFKEGRKVIGVSKLARLVEIFARRLQIQERIGEQVTEVIMKIAGAYGAACIIEAKHLCMSSRGVEKQNSVMVTSSLKGKFLEKSQEGVAARQELMALLGMKL